MIDQLSPLDVSLDKMVELKKIEATVIHGPMCNFLTGEMLNIFVETTRKN